MIRFLAILLACMIALPFGGAYEHAHAGTDAGSGIAVALEFAHADSEQDVPCCTTDETLRIAGSCAFVFDAAVSARHLPAREASVLALGFPARDDSRDGLAPPVLLDPPRPV